MTPFILYLLKANGLLLLLLVFYFLFLRKETFFAAIRYYFLIGIILSLILPLLSYTKTVYMEQTVDWSLLLNQRTEIPSEVVQPSFFEQLDIVVLLPYVFGGITFIIGLFFCGRISGLIRHIKRLQFWKAQTNIKVDHSTQEAYSFWNWIVLPFNYKEIETLETIIQHEYIHVQQKHTFDLLVVQLVRRVFWFNPLLLLLERVVRLNLEYIVDQQVATLQNRYDYQMALVQFEQTKTPSLSLVNSFGSSDLKKRIIMLNQPKSKNMKKSKFVLCLPLAVGFFLLFQVHTKAEIRFVDQETVVEQEPEKKKEAKGTTVVRNNGEELSTAQKETLDALVQKAKEGVVSETAEANQTESGTIYVTTNGSKRKIKMTLNGKELTEEEHRLITEKGKAEGKKQTYMFTSTGTDSKTRIVINGKEYSVDELVQAGLNDSGVTTSYTYTFEGDPLSDEMKKAIESSRKEMEASRKDMEASRKEMEKSRKDMEASRKDMEKSWKEKKKLRKQELEQIKDKLIIYNGKEMSLAELEKISPNGLGGGNINIYSTKESIEKYGDKGKNGVIVVTSGTNQEQRIDAKGKTISTFSVTSVQDNGDAFLYIVDGKRIKPSELSAIKSEEIESMHVLKGEMAKEKYGKEGENGVIEIIKKK